MLIVVSVADPGCLSRNYFFTQKIVTKFLKTWVWDPDPRSGIRKKPITDPGVKKPPDP
jgi:hypothetical protein